MGRLGDRWRWRRGRGGPECSGRPGRTRRPVARYTRCRPSSLPALSLHLVSSTSFCQPVSYTSLAITMATGAGLVVAYDWMKAQKVKGEGKGGGDRTERAPGAEAGRPPAHRPPNQPSNP